MRARARIGFVSIVALVRGDVAPALLHNIEFSSTP
jgi:hypothetical protein